jgi:hypothetical protein
LTCTLLLCKYRRGNGDGDRDAEDCMLHSDILLMNTGSAGEIFADIFSPRPSIRVAGTAVNLSLGKLKCQTSSVPAAVNRLGSSGTPLYHE